MGPRIIVVDGNRDDLECVRSHLFIGGFTAVDALTDPRKSAALLESGASYDVALFAVGSVETAHLLEALRRSNAGTECILLAPCDGVPPAAQWLRQGAYACLVKPFAVEDLLSCVQRALERKHLLDLLHVGKSRYARGAAPSAPFQAIVTRSRSLLRMLQEAELLATSDVPILITGERGAGKEHLARAMHAASSRAGRPFLRISLESMSPESIEAKLFGLAPGAPLEASQGAEAPLLASCDHGTLFLKGIDTLAPSLQSRLVRAIQGEEAGTRMAAAGVRWMAASDESPEQNLNAGRICNELVYWVRGSRLHVPPLRKRPEDIPVLIDYFLRQDSPPGTQWQVEETALTTLQSYPFPENVSELRAILRSAMARAKGHLITNASLPQPLRRNPVTPESLPILPLAVVEEQHIRSVYQQLGRNKVRAARALGVGLNTLRRKLKRYDLK